MAERETIYITIGKEDLLTDLVWDSGEYITVSSGVTLSDVTLTHNASGLTFEENAGISNDFSVAAPVKTSGDVRADNASVILDISRLKEEAELLIEDYTPFNEVKNWSVNVSPNQDKGVYELIGNAAEFKGTITVTSSSGMELGQLSLASNVLNYDVTRYTLGIDEKGVLTLTVSSNITDEASYVFLYKNNQLVTHLKEIDGVSVSSTGEYDHIVLIENALAGDIKLLSGGLLTVYAGATAAGIEHSANGKLRFDYSAGDSTVITGVNQYGTFFVENNKLFNVVGENVSLAGDLDVFNYHSTGSFTSQDGVVISGAFASGSKSVFYSGTVIRDCSVTGSNLNFESGVTVTNTTISGGSFNYFRGGTYDNVTISSNYNYLYGGSYSNVTISSGYVYGTVTLTGTLTVKGNLSLSRLIDARGNTIVLDYTHRKVTDGAILNGYYVSEDARFKLQLIADQSIGTFNVLGNSDVRSKYYFDIEIAGVVLGTLSHENNSFEYGNFVYTMTSGKALEISLSANADETFNVLFWDHQDIFGHARDLFTASAAKGSYKLIQVRKNGLAGDITLDSDGTLEVQRGGSAVGIHHKNNGILRFDYTAGDSTLISGINQYGTFFVQNNQLFNVIGENVNLSGNISVVDYHSKGTLTANNGVAFTGILDTGSAEATFGGGAGAAVTISNANVTGYSKNFYNVSVTDSNIGGTFTYFRGGTYENITVNGSYTYFYGGTFKDSVWYGGTLYGTVELAGTLTIKGNIGSGGGVINAHYNTIVLDYTNRTVTSGAIIALNRVNEEVVFDIAIRDDQNVGTYTIASNAGSFIDTFHITIGDERIGTFDNTKTFFEYGNFSYTMFWDSQTQNIHLKIDVSENADENFNVLCYSSTDELFYARELSGIVVDGTECAKITVRNGGWLADTKLNNGIIEVRSGAKVYGLEQSANGKLRFNYAAGDNTLISGVNQYGTFFVEEDKLFNVSGENVNVTGDVIVENYHSNGNFKGEGITVVGNFYGSGTFVSVEASQVNFNGSVTVKDDSRVSDSTFNSSATLSGGNFDTITVNGSATLSGGTFSEVTLKGSNNINGRIVLDGGLYISGNTSISYASAIDAAGYEVNLDLTSRTTESGTMINLNRLYNADLTLTIYANQTLGTYSIGSDAGSIGQGDGKGFWDIDTNTWLYKNTVQGDLDGIITLRSADGIELARCTVNGETEYFGRYNYRVYTDEKNVLKLQIGWNNKGSVTFTDDGFNNNTRETATLIEGSGVKTLSGRTIHDENDSDWYKFTLERTGAAASNITISFKQWAGDLDMELFDADGNRIDYARSVTDNETISLQGLEAGDYYIRVYGDDGETNSYSLTATLPVKPDLSDAYEKGNTVKDASYLNVISSDKSFKGAISEAGDVDFYTFVIGRNGTSSDSVTLNFDPELGNLDLYLYDHKGKRLLGKSISVSGGSENITFKGLAQGEYMIKVVAANGEDTADYTLDFTIRGKAVDPDKYENNNTLKKAKNLYALHGKNQNKGLSIHSSSDVDYFKFKLKETGSADDWIAIDYEAVFGDLDIEILDEKGKVVAFSRTTENTDKASLAGLEAGNYYVRVQGCHGVTNTYDMSWNITNSNLIVSDNYEGVEPVLITQDQTISDLSIAAPKEDDETRADVFKIQLEYDAWSSSKIILTDFRADWEEGMAWKISSDAAGKHIIAQGVSSEISLAGLDKGTWYLTIDTPVKGQHSEYSLIARNIPDGEVEQEKNAWSVFVYLAGDNNLEGAYLNELLWMQQAILPAGVEVYVLMDRSEGYSVGERNWSDTRVGKIVHSPGSAVAVQWLYFDGVDTDTYMNTSNLEQRKEWNTGEVATLEAFLDWGMKTGKADNYALIMKDHGTSLGFNSSDETSNSIMNITDIAELLGKEKYNDLSVVAFDQCLMGSDVVISTLEGNVDYVVASEAVGWTPNQLIMYKVLLNSLSADMTPQELAQKIVGACNCSGNLDLTSASFHVADSTLSEALNAFAEASYNFSRADWMAICKSFALAYNYGDSICAYSDLGFLLDAIKETKGISTTLLDATETLYDIVVSGIIDSTMIVPASYGTGFAVFNPVQSSPLMKFYSYGPGAELDYYSTVTGQSEWGQFLRVVGLTSTAFTSYFVDERTQLTFTDFSYSFVDDDIQVNYNLGEFYGDGVEYKGLYLEDTFYFTITLDNAGVAGDMIRIVADNPDANITMSLVQLRPTLLGIELIERRVSENGVLSLEGIDNDNAAVLTQYFLTITTDQATRCDLIFDAQWTSGSDYFDYSRSGNQLGKQGNGSIEKATVLSAGRYGGLVTWQGDADYYQLTSVYANEIEVTITGSGLTVYEYDKNGKLIQIAAESDGKYSITIANGNYLYVEGNGSCEAGKVNSYQMEVSDSADTWLEPDGSDIPHQLVATPDTTDWAKEVVITLNISENSTFYYKSLDNLREWSEAQGNTFTVTENNMYFFILDPQGGPESECVVDVSTIDNVAPLAPVVTVDVSEPTQGNVTVSAEFPDDENGSVVKQYSRDGGKTWEEYSGPVTMYENGTLLFRSLDAAGNVSEVITHEVTNIDRTPPEIEFSDNLTTMTNQDIQLDIKSNEDASWEFSYDNEKWTTPEGDTLTITDNGDIYIKITDRAGNSKIEKITITTIDRTAPVLTVSGNREKWGREDVVLNVEASESVKIQYSFDESEWFTAEAPALFSLDESVDYVTSAIITVTGNSTVFIKAADLAGNVTTAQIEVTKIDKDAPQLEITGNPSGWTNEDVTLSVTAADASGATIYFRNVKDADFTEYKNGITVTENGTYIFYAVDIVGNKSEEHTVTVDKIDKDLPDLKISGNPVNWTNQNVLLTASSQEEGVNIEYSFDNASWSSGVSVSVTENKTVYFKVTDKAGNITEETVEVIMIDKEPPKFTISENTLDVTNQDVIVTASSDEADLIFAYKVGDETQWHEGDSVTVTKNTTVEFSATDLAGNVTTQSFVVGNIDKEAPPLTVAADKTNWTNQDVVVTASSNEENVTFTFRVGDETQWHEGYAVTVAKNCKIEFKVKDLAGNVTTQSFEVGNIDKDAPDLTVEYEKKWTNQAVVVTASSQEEGVNIEYSFDNASWSSGVSVSVTENNTTVYFRVTDKGGNVVEDNVTITNIDKDAPVLEITGNPGKWTNENVTLSAAASDERGATVWYKKDGDADFTEYEGGISVTENGDYIFYAVDGLGNKTEERTVSVTKIDKAAPVLEITGNPEIWTNQDVVLRAAATDACGATIYFRNEKDADFTEYKDGITVTENGNYIFYAVDEAGNTSAETTVSVTKIDNAAPKLEITGNPEIWTNQDVVLSVTATDDCGVKIWYKNEKDAAFTEYKDGVTVTENGNYIFYAVDEADNTSAETTVSVTKIDKAAPKLEITGNPGEWTNQDVTLSAAGSDDRGVTIYYKKAGAGEYTPYTVPFTVSENGDYIFYAVDGLGNKTEERTVSVTKIDKEKPELSVKGNYESWTNQDVVLTASSNEDQVKIEYRIEGEENWTTGEVVTLTENKVVHFRVTDKGNNVIEKSVNVNWIDREKPVLTVSGTPSEWTNKDVTLIVTSNEEATFQYRIGETGEWKEGKKAVVSENNTTVYFKVTDLAGNVAETEFTVENIDKEKPILTISGNPEIWTNQDVTLKADSNEDVEYEYSYDELIWYSGSEAVVTANNTTVYFKATDKGGNIVVERVTVDKIDKEKPILTISGNPEVWTNQDVTLKAAAGEDVKFEYSYDEERWYSGSEAVVTENNTTVYFRATDKGGNIVVESVTVDKIDKVVPCLTVTGAPEEWTKEDVELTLSSSEDECIFEYSFDNSNWVQCVNALVTVENNGTVYLKVTDKGGNSTVQSVTISKIDKELPTLEVAGNVSNWTQTGDGGVFLNASTNEKDAVIQYSFDQKEWTTGTRILVIENIDVYFRVIDKAGNVVEHTEVVRYIDNIAPGVVENLSAGTVREDETIGEKEARFSWSEVEEDEKQSGVKGYEFRYGKSEDLSGEKVFYCESANYQLTDLAVGEWYYQVRAVDGAGNKGAWSQLSSFTIVPEVPEMPEIVSPDPGNVENTVQEIVWGEVKEATGYVVEYTVRKEDGTESVLSFSVDEGAGLDLFSVPEGTLRVRTEEDTRWTGEQTISSTETSESCNFVSVENGKKDLFIAVAKGTWGAQYMAKHRGNDFWRGTGSEVSLEGKNQFTDTFRGSADDNILVLSDDSCGDAFFVDDVYSNLGAGSRLKEIKEIRAGAGDDVVDMTSSRFSYSGSKITICGGDGNDYLWGSAECNILFGDGGNDELIGSCGNDYLIGGSGNDTMHGGGGDDIFCFGGNWGRDSVEQTFSGKVTLCFESESVVWDEEKQAWTDGFNTVTVKGTRNVTVKYGNFGTLPEGAFAEAVSGTIFEEAKLA